MPPQIWCQAYWSLRKPSAKYDSPNPPGIKRLVVVGAQLRPFSLDRFDAYHEASQDLFAEVSAKNAVFKTFYASKQ